MSEENKGFNWEIPRKPEQPETKQLDLNFLDIMAILAGLQLLKKKQIFTVRKIFPSVEMMEYLLFILIHLGFIMLTMILVSSFIFDDFAILPNSIKQKVFISIAAWLIFGIIIALRKFRGWQGLKSACWSMVAYLLLLMAYFSHKLFT